jgi:hypothetical protein
MIGRSQDGQQAQRSPQQEEQHPLASRAAWSLVVHSALTHHSAERQMVHPDSSVE